MDRNGDMLEYRHLMKRDEYKEIWGHGYGNKIGRLAQGMPGRVDRSDTMHFIHKHEVPRDIEGGLAQLVERVFKNRVTRGSKPGAGTNTLLVPIRLKNFQSGVGTGVHTLLIVSSGLLLIISGFGGPHTIEWKRIQVSFLNVVALGGLFRHRQQSKTNIFFTSRGNSKSVGKEIRDPHHGIRKILDTTSTLLPPTPQVEHNSTNN